MLALAASLLSALLSALTRCQEAGTCPEWIVRAVYSIILTEIDEHVGQVGRWYKTHEQDVIDFVRAEFIRAARRHGFSWVMAGAFAAEFYAPTPAGNVDGRWQRRDFGWQYWRG